MRNDTYFETRLVSDDRREILWQTLCQNYFSKIIMPEFCVLELGAGYGHFINNVRCRRKIAVDCWKEFPRYISDEVETRVCYAWELDFLEEECLDFVLASNVFEHMTQGEFRDTLEILKEKLKRSGTVNIIQPNYRFAFREYFDDYTHISIFSDISMCDFIRSAGYDILERKARFLPLTIRSKFPVWPFLIRLYLLSPIKPFAKQMLIRAVLKS